MPSAPPEISGTPAAPLPRGRSQTLRAARTLAVLAVIAVPFVVAEQGRSGGVVAGVAFPSFGGAAGAELQPRTGQAAPSAPALAFEQASPFVASYGDAASALRAETCLTEAIYFEGALEPESGQRAIAQVVLNRVRHPAYPDSICGVVFEGQHRSTGCQFTFTCDGSRARPPVPSLWARANRIAKAALGGAVAPEVGLSTHYHADYVTPYWSASLDPSGQIGRHLFYRWRGTTGRASSFTMRYSGKEPEIAAYSPRAATAEESPADVPAAARAESVAEITGTFVPAPPAPAATPFRARPLRLATDAADGAK
jgi:spore germination cell wall hydrolase CwlJ-like protein